MSKISRNVKNVENTVESVGKNRIRANENNS